jgi:phosphoribosylanthranilate isomerase
MAAAVAERRRTILSGGLNAENVRDAIVRVRPHMIDVSSGVESAPGQKDPAKLEAFFAAVAAA